MKFGLGAAAAAAVGAVALRNHRKQKEAELRNPPRGRFIEIDGVSLHYVEAGRGPPVVLVHGNGTTLEDWFASEIFPRLAKHCHVVAMDRPGFGFSSRPRSRLWTPKAQADVIALAMRSLGIEGATVVGHSFGTQVALALALDHPQLVSRLVLVSGYYFPSARADVGFLAPTAIPVVGDLMRFTISPIVGELMRERVEERLFGPAEVDPRWRNFPIEMALRPSQIRAEGADAAIMIPGAASLSKRYGELRLPVTLIAGDGDRFVTTAEQTERLAGELAQADLIVVRGAGHMLHYAAGSRLIGAIVHEAEAGEGETVALSDAPA